MVVRQGGVSIATLGLEHCRVPKESCFYNCAACSTSATVCCAGPVWTARPVADNQALTVAMEEVEDTRIFIGQQPTACAFHPSENLLFAGSYGGTIFAYSFHDELPTFPHECASDKNEFRWTYAREEWNAGNGLAGAGCRALSVPRNGSTVVAGAVTGQIAFINTSTGRIVRKIEPKKDAGKDDETHPHSIFCVQAMDGGLVASGHAPSLEMMFPCRPLGCAATRGDKHLHWYPSCIKASYGPNASCGFIPIVLSLQPAQWCRLLTKLCVHCRSTAGVHTDTPATTQSSGLLQR
jgi:hypothetical protein